jgi:hypothetical protein
MPAPTRSPSTALADRGINYESVCNGCCSAKDWGPPITSSPAPSFAATPASAIQSFNPKSSSSRGKIDLGIEFLGPAIFGYASF